VHRKKEVFSLGNKKCKDVDGDLYKGRGFRKENKVVSPKSGFDSSNRHIGDDAQKQLCDSEHMWEGEQG
jgi:hypothetical protein